MKISNSLLCFFLLIAIILFSACPHKTPNPVADLEYFFPPKYIHKSIEIPEPLRQSSDSIAQVVVNYVNLTNECEKYLPYINPPDSILLESSIEPLWNYKWTAHEGYFIFLKVSIYPDNSCGWKVKLWGTDTTTGKYYHNWDFLSASQSAGKNEGYLGVNQDPETEIHFSYYWTSEDNELQYDLIKSSHNGHGLLLDIEICLFYDLSGELIKRIKITDPDRFYIRDEGVVEYRYSWNVDGKGQWWEYDIEGNVINSGSWN